MALVVQNPLADAGDLGDMGLIPGLERCPGGGKWQPAPVFFPGEFHRQRSLAGYRARSCRESNTTEWLSTEHSRVTWRQRLQEGFPTSTGRGRGQGKRLELLKLRSWEWGVLGTGTKPLRRGCWPRLASPWRHKEAGSVRVSEIANWTQLLQ